MAREKKKGKHAPEKKKLSGGKKAAIAAAVIVGVLLVAVGTVYAVFHHYYGLLKPGGDDSDDPYWTNPNNPLKPSGSDSTDRPEDPTGGSDKPPEETEAERIERELLENLHKQEENSGLYNTDAFNLMLIGVDARQDSFVGRSDSMILLSINKTTKKIVMTSFLRDIYCTIPGYTYGDRLNAAYAYGGINLHKQTIKANFGITVDRCVVVNFYIVKDAVDAVGGIDLELTAEEIGQVNRNIRYQNELFGQDTYADLLPEGGGTYHVNGNQALGYARVRYIGTDFARTGRQRTVIAKCLEKIKTMSLGKLNDLAKQFLPQVKTDLTEADCASLLLTLLDISDYEVESMVIPMDGTWEDTYVRGMDVLVLDFDANAKAWHQKVEGK